MSRRLRSLQRHLGDAVADDPELDEYGDAEDDEDGGYDDPATQPGGAHGGGWVRELDPPVARDDGSTPSGTLAAVALTLACALALVLALAVAWWRGSVPLRVLIHPPGATALCRDRSYSYARSRGGACSHHEGVVAWIARDTPATPNAPLTARVSQ
jgi:hypothetical protein